MNKSLLNITSIFLIIFVLFLSIGANISKMHCSKGNKFFIGTEVSNCVDETKVYCDLNIEELSCCAKEKMLESCCAKNKDNSCASEIKIIQFDFETLLYSSILSINLFHLNNNALFFYNCRNENSFNYYSKFKPPPLNSEIILFQAFLL